MQILLFTVTTIHTHAHTHKQQQKREEKKKERRWQRYTEWALNNKLDHKSSQIHTHTHKQEQKGRERHTEWAPNNELDNKSTEIPLLLYFSFHSYQYQWACDTFSLGIPFKRFTIKTSKSVNKMGGRDRGGWGKRQMDHGDGTISDRQQLSLFITWTGEASKEKALEDLPRTDEKGPSPIRPIWELFQQQRWETERWGWSIWAFPSG